MLLKLLVLIATLKIVSSSWINISTWLGRAGPPLADIYPLAQSELYSFSMIQLYQGLRGGVAPER